ncbi:MAG: DUF6512 family protein [Candidatus Caldarchaeum sp.]|nr:DUF6512 family protein [Candidatus Caldarchaeum sp.]
MTVLLERRFLKQSELAGVPFIILMGSLLHFTYEMSGRNPAVALISAVNESVWEHLKLPFFPALMLAAFQYARLRKFYPNFFYGKAVGVFSMPVIIVVGFYAYKAVFHSSNLAYDIGLFMASVAAGQLISYKLVLKHGVKPVNILPIIALTLAVALFFLFTFNPPHLEIFKDPLTGGYGVGSRIR